MAACNDDNDQEQTSPTENVTEPTLISFAKLPVETYAAGPDSGAYVKGANGIYPPFKGQPVQGFSAALKMKMAVIWQWPITVLELKIIQQTFTSYL